MSTRYVPVWLSVLIALVGVAFLAVGVIYFADSASSLPSFFPGHETVTTSHHHTKHGVAAVIVGLVLLAAAWISTGKKETASSAQTRA
jgi:drug/metabolite transporter (DMT)-like permease